MATNDLPDFQTAIRSISQGIVGPESVKAASAGVPGAIILEETADASWRSITVLCDSTVAGDLYFTLGGSTTGALFSPAVVEFVTGYKGVPMAPNGVVTIPVSLAYEADLTVVVYNNGSVAHDVYVVANMTDATVSVQGAVTPQSAVQNPLVLPVEITSVSTTQGAALGVLAVAGASSAKATVASGASVQIVAAPASGKRLCLSRWAVNLDSIPTTGSPNVDLKGVTSGYPYDLLSPGPASLGGSGIRSGSLNGQLVNEAVEVYNGLAVGIEAYLFYDTITTPVFG